MKRRPPISIHPDTLFPYPTLFRSIACAESNRLEPAEHVELGQRDAGDARHGAALAHQHRVEPTAATLAPGHGAEFMPRSPSCCPVSSSSSVGKGPLPTRVV